MEILFRGMNLVIPMKMDRELVAELLKCCHVYALLEMYFFKQGVQIDQSSLLGGSMYIKVFLT